MPQVKIFIKTKHETSQEVNSFEERYIGNTKGWKNEDNQMETRHMQK